MKSVFEQLNKIPKIAFTIVAVVLALLLTGSVVILLILPSYDELNQINRNIETQKQKVLEIKATLAFLQSENKSKLVDYTNFFNQLVPEQRDMPHFVALNEIVAAAVGASVQSVTVFTGGVKKTQRPTAAGASSKSTLVQTAPTTVSVTYSSSYDVLLDLIDAWEKADELVGVSLVKATAQADGILNYTIDYFLSVLEKPAKKATIGEKIQFSQTEKDKIDDLRNKIIYFATPSAQPVGKNNPFQ